VVVVGWKTLSILARVGAYATTGLVLALPGGTSGTLNPDDALLEHLAINKLGSAAGRLFHIAEIDGEFLTALQELRDGLPLK